MRIEGEKLIKIKNLTFSTHIIKKGEIIPKTKDFGCVGYGRSDSSFLFKSCEIDRSQGRLV